MGMVCLELDKLVAGKNNIEDHRKGFVNLVLPLSRFRNLSPLRTRCTAMTTDRFKILRDITLQELTDQSENEYALEVEIVSSGVPMRSLRVCVLRS